MKTTVASLTPRHLRIVDLSIKGLGINEIAEKLEMSRYMVSVVTHSPTFKHEFALRRAVQEDLAANTQVQEDDEVTRTLREGAILAAAKLVDHVGSGDEKVSERSCEAILDRTGYGKQREDVAAAVGPTIIISNEDSRRIIESLELDGQPIKKAR